MILFENLTSKDLWRLREEICLNSLYISDYKNSFGFTSNCICTFFDGFMSYIEEIANEDGVKDLNTIFEKYDNEENLYSWFCCFEDFSWVEYEITDEDDETNENFWAA